MSAVRCSRSTHWPGMAVPVATTVEDPHSVKSALRRSGGHGDPNCVTHEPLVGTWPRSSPRRHPGGRVRGARSHRRGDGVARSDHSITNYLLRQLLLLIVQFFLNLIPTHAHATGSRLRRSVCHSECVTQRLWANRESGGRATGPIGGGRAGGRGTPPAGPALSGHAARASR